MELLIYQPKCKVLAVALRPGRNPCLFPAVFFPRIPCEVNRKGVVKVELSSATSAVPVPGITSPVSWMSEMPEKSQFDFEISKNGWGGRLFPKDAIVFSRR